MNELYSFERFESNFKADISSFLFATKKRVKVVAPVKAAPGPAGPSATMKKGGKK
jgi:hypothetical protein